MTNKTAQLEIRDLVRLMAYYKTMNADVAGHELLKMGGFKINGLDGTDAAKLTCLCRGDHRLATHKVYGAICTCGTWFQDQAHDKAKALAQHSIHARLSKGTA